MWLGGWVAVKLCGWVAGWRGWSGWRGCVAGVAAWLAAWLGVRLSVSWVNGVAVTSLLVIFY